MRGQKIGHFEDTVHFEKSGFISRTLNACQLKLVIFRLEMLRLTEKFGSVFFSRLIEIEPNLLKKPKTNGLKKKEKKKGLSCGKGNFKK